MYDIGKGTVMAESKIGGLIAAGLVIVVALAIGGWQLGWWASNSAANHQAQITFNGLGAQTGDMTAARSGIGEIATIGVQIADPSTPSSELSALRSQKAALVTQTCAYALNITMKVPSDIRLFIADNCK